MNIQEFNRRILQKQKQLSDLMRRKMPVIAGNIAKRHIEEDFRKGGFTDNGFHKWQETKRQKSGGKGAGSRYGPLLSGRSHLARSIEYTPGDRQVTVFTRVSSPAFITGEERCILLSLLRCDASPGRSTTGKQAKTRRKTPSGSALP